MDLSDLHPKYRDERFFGHLSALAPKAQVKRFLDFLFGRRTHIFTYAYHTHDSRNSQPGYPDVTLVHPRRQRLMLVELKRDGEYPTIEQRLWLAALRCVQEAAPDVVSVRLYRPRDWPEIVRDLGGIDTKSR